MNVESPAHAQAIEWHIRLRHGDDATWAAFAEWLAEDPAHALAYDAVEQADDAIEPLLPEVDFRQAANDAAQTVPVRAPIRWRMVGGGIAASLAGLLAMSPYLASGRYDVATGPGEHRIVKLDATTQIMLNGATRMTLDHKDPRFAALAEGEAFFQVRHDAGHPFHLEIGTDRLVDIGTEFNVTRDAGETRVDVAEGEVAYITKTATTPLTAGASLAVRATSGAIRVTHTTIAAIGGWRSGRLTYARQPLSQVAADLSRALGLHIDVVPGIASRPISGSIMLTGKGVDQLRRLAPVLDVTLEPMADGWIMKPSNGADH